MGFNDVLKKLFGNKSDRDMKELMPIVGKVNAEWNKIKNLSNDELREVANGLKVKIKEHIREEETEIADLKRKVQFAEDISGAFYVTGRTETDGYLVFALGL